MSGSNLPRHIVEKFEKRWAQKLRVQARALKSAKPGGLADRVGYRHKPWPEGYPINPGSQSTAAERAIARSISGLDHFG